MRKGFSLIETLVALVLFQVGMLAVAAAMAVAARDLATAKRTERAHEVARNRVELLRAGACPVPALGTSEHPGGLAEYWRVEAVADLRNISDSVVFALPRGRSGHVVFRAATICSS